MAGIHVHTQDVNDEGPQEIARRLARMDDVEYVFAQVNTIFERNPSPTGVLEHNPVSDVVIGEGLLYSGFDPKEVYPGLHQRWEPDPAKRDPLATLRDSPLNESYTIVPWVNVLNGDFLGDVENSCVRDFTGERVGHWLCPNGPHVVEMWARIIRALVAEYGWRTVMIDRIRFPDWSGRELEPRSILSCFCPACLREMPQAGIDADELRRDMRTVATSLGEKRFAEAVAFFTASASLRSWVAFRQHSVSRMVENLAARTRELCPEAELWLDVWPPSYGWLLGQDLTRLTQAGEKLKHFPYHRLGGGADVQGFIEYFADDDAGQEAAFRAFLDVFDLPYDLTYRRFKQDGFPLEFVRRENEKVRRLAQEGTRVYSGVQMWNLSPAELLEATKAAYASAADDVIYYCYGWASDELFGASNGARDAGTA
ncbi:hypothetical protein [Rhizohabitans arisaemae]|uniref:hypothetical protein n=1 Tax=Rhizohabitans arisaemae TaxID=2720610 RepID=UPI0024B17E22|nr:hypothetical protein [Rhizohabitans arisaemae]